MSTTARRVRVGLVGCGGIAAYYHLPALRSLPGVEVAAVAEPDAGRRQAAGVPGFEHWEPMFEAVPLDAVVVCLPPALHVPCGVAAFERGLAVYMEKPLAPTAAEARRLLDAGAASGRVGMTGFNFRFHPMYVAARERIRSGALGPVLAIRTCFASLSAGVPDWRLSKATGGGVLLDEAVHHIDITRFLLDTEIVRAQVIELAGTPTRQGAALQLETREGVPVQILVTMGSTEEHHFEVQGELGRLVGDRLLCPEPEFRPVGHLWSRRAKVVHGLRALRPSVLALSPGREDSFRAALAAFTDAVAAGGPSPRPDLRDGLAALEVLELAEASRPAPSPA